MSSLETPPGLQSASGNTILVVEDDPTIRTLICSIIEDEIPYPVIAAADGAQALEIVQTIEPCLFLLDYFLPDMTGLELYEHLCQIEQRITVPALFMTACVPFLEDHPISFPVLRKPFNVDDLLAMITQALASL
ncbi:MAG: response regulator [Ktedonobacteraceae bacterium]|nr:response regulator [Ktedonobacteraceae bacterium]